jgi:hypothetical protein
MALLKNEVLIGRLVKIRNRGVWIVYETFCQQLALGGVILKHGGYGASSLFLTCTNFFSFIIVQANVNKVYSKLYSSHN